MDNTWTAELPTEKSYYWVFDPTQRKDSRKVILVWFENAGMIRIFGGAWLGAPQFKGRLWCKAEQPAPPQASDE